jgi:hypothetical protein
MLRLAIAVSLSLATGTMVIAQAKTIKVANIELAEQQYKELAMVIMHQIEFLTELQDMQQRDAQLAEQGAQLQKETSLSPELFTQLMQKVGEIVVANPSITQAQLVKQIEELLLADNAYASVRGVKEKLLQFIAQMHELIESTMQIFQKKETADALLEEQEKVFANRGYTRAQFERVVETITMQMMTRLEELNKGA